MRALVTGSSGFLGRHFVQALSRQGYQVRQVDIADDAGRWDARDYFRHAGTGIDLAIHCAAVVGGRQTIESFPTSQIVDLSLDAECFQWALRTKPGRLVYLSSSAVYPVELQNEYAARYGWRLREDNVQLDYPHLPDALYGWTKLTGELLARHAQEVGLPMTVVRPFSGYGADQDPAYPFPAFVARAKRREQPFPIWGDGEQVRDFVHVSDVVGATLAAVAAEEPGPLNICSGHPTSFNKLAELVCEVAGYTPRFEHRLEAPRGVLYRVGDPTRMHRLYEPKVSLEEGVRLALQQTPAVRSA